MYRHSSLGSSLFELGCSREDGLILPRVPLAVSVLPARGWGFAGRLDKYGMGMTSSTPLHFHIWIYPSPPSSFSVSAQREDYSVSGPIAW